MNETDAQLSVTVTEGGIDQFVAVGRESTILTMLAAWRTRVDGLRAEAIALHRRQGGDAVSDSRTGPANVPGTIPFRRPS